MPRGYRSVILAFGLILCGASEAPKQNAAPERQKAVKTIQQPVPKISAAPSKAAKAVEPPEYYQPCEQRGSQGNSDLCAQWTAAKAAQQAADWAWWQMWFSGLGVIGLGITLWFNFGALRVAEREAEETRGALAIAERQFVLSEQTARQQLRAYVSISEVHPDKYEVGVKFGITLTVSNRGQTPAYRLSAYPAILAVDLPFDENSLVINPDSASHGSVNLGPSDSSNFRAELSRELTVMEVDAFNRGKIGWYAYGYYSYMDAFGEYRYCTYRMYLESGGRFVPCESGNEST